MNRSIRDGWGRWAPLVERREAPGRTAPTGISQATSYCHLHEGIDILAAQAPDLHAVLDRRREEEMSHAILDGMLSESDRLAGTRDNGNDLWFSQKHKSFGGNVQFLSAPDGTPLWGSDVEPGPTPDITAARPHILPALYKAAADGLSTLADKGCIGIRVPVRRPKGSRNKPSTPTPTPRTTWSETSAPSVSAPLPNSKNAGARSSASPSAPAVSATEPAPPLPSTATGSELH
ncbi:transposase family protein [Streptomyces sp. NPDC048685]|uniref:transposase family protein n=1 Tax=Streptomyces sp. NPDC048685 TaxID=3365584 RepID=UPI00371BD00E